MKVRILGKPFDGRRPADTRQARFRAVLLAALNTRFYAPLLESAALGTPEEIAGLNSIEEALLKLPSADPRACRAPSSFWLNEDAPRAARRELFWPLPPAARTAVLMEGFRPSNGIEVFHQVRRSQLAHYGPDALAGPVSELRRLAEPAEDRGARIPRLSHSVIAFSILLQAFLSDEARELFWRVFKVPVFGQVLSPGGQLLAWECEAHEGFHIERDHAVFETEFGGGEPELLVTSLVDLRQPALRLATGLTGRIEHAACGCGLSGLRLAELRRRSLARLPARAAYASCAAG